MVFFSDLPFVSLLLMHALGCLLVPYGGQCRKILVFELFIWIVFLLFSWWTSFKNSSIWPSYSSRNPVLGNSFLVVNMHLNW
jgi:hypothetical protein